MMRILVLFFCCFFIFSVQSKEKNGVTVSPWLYKKSKKIEKLIAKKSYSQAQQKLEEILSDVKKGKYEHAFVLKSLSSVHALKGSYNKAAELLAKSIALKVMPTEEEQQAILNLGQLYMATDLYDKAIRTLEPWLKTHPNPDLQINVLVANAYTQLKHYRKALPYIKNAIAQSKKPKEAWYQLNLAIYYELEEYSSAIDVLKILVRRYPDKETYWQQLSSIYQQVKQYKKAVSIKSLAYKKGFMTTEKEILDLANLFLYISSPYKAAKILEQEFKQKRIKHTSKNWEMLANAWTMAKELDLAVKALETASSLNSKGSLYLQLGQIYVGLEKWNQAIESLKKALNKGGLKNAGAAHLLLGMSYYEINEIKTAKESFSKATKFSKSKKSAKQWIDYIKESS